MLKAKLPPRDGGSHNLFCAGTTRGAPHLCIGASSGNPATETEAFGTLVELQPPQISPKMLTSKGVQAKAHPDLEDPYTLLLPSNS